jgi:uncharacterized protein
MTTKIIELTRNHIRSLLENEGTGHDWWHIYRVWNNAKYIAKQEQANMLVVELAALLHDIADWKFNGGDTKIGAQKAREWLENLKVEPEIINEVCHIVENCSFKGANAPSEKLSLEGMIVQDADRLDAIGAIGIARTFAYGGHKGRALYDPNIAPQLHASFEEYKKNQSPTINHFYEKLLLLKDKMNTQTGKTLAEERHQFMEDYLKQFMNEWNCLGA